jgi:hypothetical protein
MTEIFGLLIAANIVSTVILWTVLAKERKRNRILGAFIAGLVRSISNYVSTTDDIDSVEMPPHHVKLPIPYNNILEAIEYELCKNFYISPSKYERWLIKTRQIFLENEAMVRDARNDGFIFMTYDLFDDLLARWRSPELMTRRQKKYLSEDVVVTKENITELQSEIAMYEDLMADKITLETPEATNIDSRLAIMLCHLKQTYRNNLKDKLLGNRPKASPDKVG